MFLDTPGLKINRKYKVHPISHSQSPQPNTPMQFSQVPWSMPRLHLGLNMHIELHRTYIWHLISVLPQTWWGPAFGWMKASLVASNLLMNRTDFSWWRQAFTSYQTWWLPQVWRKCFPSNFEHPQGVWEMFSFIISNIYVC